jgi:hypothetical protein
MKHPETIEGTLRHLVYSPGGEIEGILLDVDDAALQVVFDPHEPELYGALMAAEEGLSIVVEATPQKPSLKGKPSHPVFDLVKLVTVDGRRPVPAITDEGPAYQGTVARFNYARHGEPNGVVLDTGDFIHTKPHGLAPLKLAIGDKVEADGEAQMLVTGKGWAVEATTVNGKAIG